MIFPLMASSQSRRATRAGSPKRSRARARGRGRIGPAQQLAAIRAVQVVGQLVEDVLAQRPRFVVARRGQIGG
jgi:hypothetical protein